jgi:hypothetical protein
MIQRAYSSYIPTSPASQLTAAIPTFAVCLAVVVLCWRYRAQRQT